uniref:Pentatricopeptide repeat-containing protein n=1 Tax=Solanum lycopersicum TaxID=4081 RepID=A0A3Q7H2H6_SOLLC
MPERNLYSWNVIIQGCLKDNRVDEALELFNVVPWRNEVSWTLSLLVLHEMGL